MPLLSEIRNAFKGITIVPFFSLVVVVVVSGGGDFDFEGFDDDSMLGDFVVIGGDGVDDDCDVVKVVATVVEATGNDDGVGVVVAVVVAVAVVDKPPTSTPTPCYCNEKKFKKN